MGKYFGTDGIRGVFGEELTEELAYLLGRAAARYFSCPCVVGRDTRATGLALQESLVRGLISGGSDAIILGVLPTPAVSRLAREGGAFGVMITASHNTAEYNGLKLFSPKGLKLTGAEEDLIEFYMDNPVGGGSGAVSYFEGAREQYISGLLSDFAASSFIGVHAGGEMTGDTGAGGESGESGESGGRGSLSGLEVCLDCGFGAAGGIAAEVFSRLGASVISLNDAPLGHKINDGCGALFIDTLPYRVDAAGAGDKKMFAENAENSGESCNFLGFAFDGDADRMAMNSGGRTIDGDSVLYNLSQNRFLKGGVVVGTVMSNIALERRLKAEGKRLIRAAVGDKHILSRLVGGGYNLGGEQSGHYIFYPECASGDGILSALVMCGLLAGGKELEMLALVPQKTISIECKFDFNADENFCALAKTAGQDLSRLLIRKSGTEPKVRIMAEDENADKIDLYLQKFANLVNELNN